MKRFPVYLLAFCALFLFLQPTRARGQDGGGDGDDDGPTVDVGQPGGGDSDGGMSEEEKEKIRKKNSGLAQPGGPGGAAEEPKIKAPKVKASLQERINKAIAAGVKWLKKRQDKDGSWGPVRANSVYGKPNVRGNFIRDPTGPTSFAIYTLAKCDVKKGDRTIKKGLAWLRSRAIKTFDVLGKAGPKDEKTHAQTSGPYALTTYESASIVLMIDAVYQHHHKLQGRHTKRRLYSDNPLRPPRRSRIPKNDWRWMHDRIVHLTVGRTIRSGGRGRGGGGGSNRIKGTQNKNGGWRYGQANGQQDLSSTQFVLLGLRAASKAGYPIKKVAPHAFEWAANFCKQVQNPGNGAFSYQAGKSWSAGMDACGIGSLLICREQMLLQGDTPPDWIDGAIKKGMAHLDEVFDVNYNKGHHEGASNLYYYLYSVERIGDLSGRKEFGGKDWYVRGARLLLAHQDPDGKWNDATSFAPRDVLGTCFALLFLKRATPPVVTQRSH